MKKRFLFMPVFGIAAIAAFGAIVMLLWNFTLPAIFGLAAINFWQASALFILARILFGSFPGRGGMPMDRRGNPFREKWEKMSPEEQKKFIEKRRNFGFGMPFGRNPFSEKEDSRTNFNSETSCQDE